MYNIIHKNKSGEIESHEGISVYEWRFRMAYCAENKLEVISWERIE